MEMKGWVGGLYRFCEWVMRLAYVNLLWIGFTLIGLVVFTFMPATAALFAVVRKWVMEQYHVPIFKTFWESFKKEFWKINLHGVVLVLIAYILYIDFQFFDSMEGFMFEMGAVITIILTFVYFFLLLSFFPIFVHYKLRFWQYYKYSFVFGLSFPLLTLVKIVGVAGIIAFLYTFEAMILFFSGSSIAYVLMWTGYRAFLKQQEYQKNMQASEENTDQSDSSKDK